MSITMILSLLVCAASLALLGAAMALPLRLLPEESAGGPRRGPRGRSDIVPAFTELTARSQEIPR